MDVGAPGIIRFTSIGSTNTEALNMAREGRSDNAWIVAAEQSGGRGRHSRSWVSPPGGLYATRLLVTHLPLHIAVGLTLVAGVAVYDAVAQLLSGTSQPDFFLKWPNDLLAGNSKLAGILIETESLGGGKIALAVGFGINVVNPIDHIQTEVTSLRTLGFASSVDETFSALATNFARRLEAWDEGCGFAAIRTAWEDRAMPLGTPTRVRLPDGTIEGCYSGVDPSGALKLRLMDGTERLINAGEIVIERGSVISGVSK